MALTILLAVFGLLLLIVGAELLVRGASTLAASFGISQLVIGLTVVAFGTSAPELAVGIKAAITHQGEVAFGNVVGSNIMNVLLILGLSAMIAPLIVSRQLIILDVPVMIGAAATLLVMSRDGVISRTDGAILFVMLIAYLCYLVYRSKRQESVEAPASSDPPAKSQSSSILLNIVLLVAGLALLVLGADWMVKGAVAVAEALHVDKLIIALTIIAVGTSLPEIATSLVATWKNQRELAVGNVVGSNIFNVLCITGIAAMVTPLPVSDQLLRFDMPVMLITCVMCWPVFLIGRRIMRIEGLVFFLAYIAYTVHLILDAMHSGALRGFQYWMMVAFVPLLGIGLLTVWLMEYRASSRLRCRRIP